MSRTQKIKVKRAHKDVKFFGFTSGLHSKFEEAKALDPERYKGETYPKKNIDYIKYGYGRSTKRENRVKNYKKEIE